ncbi:MAG: hypothetical protein HKN88_10015 [Gammaproteobacteria bacterium]|nr:hypothetical protein [Gammaproteobacteria bacterium]
MVVSIPVLEDMNGYFIITLYESSTDGNFKRTGKRPFRILTGVINGVSSPLGSVECNPRIRRSMITWRSPSVIRYADPRPQSVYQFFRENLVARKYYIATSPYSAARTKKLDLHEIQFKPGVSPGIKKLFSEKCVDAMRIWGVSKKVSKR